MFGRLLLASCTQNQKNVRGRWRLVAVRVALYGPVNFVVSIWHSNQKYFFTFWLVAVSANKRRGVWEEILERISQNSVRMTLKCGPQYSIPT